MENGENGMNNGGGAGRSSGGDPKRVRNQGEKRMDAFMLELMGFIPTLLQSSASECRLTSPTFFS